MLLFKKIYSLARPYGRKRLAVVAALTCLQGIVQTVGVSSIFPFLAIASDPRAVRQSPIGSEVLQRLPEMSDQSMLIIAGLGAIAMLLISNGLHLLTVYATANYTRGFGHWLRVRLLRQIVAQDYSYFLQRSTAVMLRKINGDVQAYITSVLMPLFVAAAGLINVVLLVVAIILVDPWVAISCGLVLSLSYAVVFSVLARHRRKYSDTMMLTNRETNRQIQQLLGGIKPI